MFKCNTNIKSTLPNIKFIKDDIDEKENLFKYITMNNIFPKYKNFILNKFRDYLNKSILTNLYDKLLTELYYSLNATINILLQNFKTNLNGTEFAELLAEFNSFNSINSINSDLKQTLNKLLDELIKILIDNVNIYYDMSKYDSFCKDPYQDFKNYSFLIIKYNFDNTSDEDKFNTIIYNWILNYYLKIIPSIEKTNLKAIFLIDIIKNLINENKKISLKYFNIYFQKNFLKTKNFLNNELLKQIKKNSNKSIGHNSRKYLHYLLSHKLPEIKLNTYQNLLTFFKYIYTQNLLSSNAVNSVTSDIKLHEVMDAYKQNVLSESHISIANSFDSSVAYNKNITILKTIFADNKSTTAPNSTPITNDELFNTLYLQIENYKQKNQNAKKYNINNDLFYIEMHGKFNFENGFKQIPENIVLVLTTPVNRFRCATDLVKRDLNLDNPFYDETLKNNILNNIFCIDKINNNPNNNRNDNNTNLSFFENALVLLPGQYYFDLNMSFGVIEKKKYEVNITYFGSGSGLINNIIPHDTQTYNNSLSSIIQSIILQKKQTPTESELSYIIVHCCRSIDSKLSYKITSENVQTPQKLQNNFNNLTRKISKIGTHIYVYENFMLYFNTLMSNCTSNIKSINLPKISYGNFKNSNQYKLLIYIISSPKIFNLYKDFILIQFNNYLQDNCDELKENIKETIYTELNNNFNIEHQAKNFINATLLQKNLITDLLNNIFKQINIIHIIIDKINKINSVELVINELNKEEFDSWILNYYIKSIIPLAPEDNNTKFIYNIGLLIKKLINDQIDDETFKNTISELTTIFTKIFEKNNSNSLKQIEPYKLILNYINKTTFNKDFFINDTSLEKNLIVNYNTIENKIFAILLKDKITKFKSSINNNKEILKKCNDEFIKMFNSPIFLKNKLLEKLKENSSKSVGNQGRKYLHKVLALLLEYPELPKSSELQHNLESQYNSESQNNSES
jgi:hypothetical protein